MSNKSILNGSISSFVRQQAALESTSINLAVLSHFDNDHLSGLLSLLGHMRIETLLLPYVPLWQRLLIAIEIGVGTGDAAFGFFVDPAAYLSTIADGRIGQIVFVTSTGPDDIPAGPEEAPEPPDGSSSDRSFGAKIEDGDPPDEDAYAYDNRAQGIPVRYLKKAGKIVVPGVWEFVPYNDASLAHKFGSVPLRRVKILSRILLTRAWLRDRALQRMKEIYESIFPPGGERNRISLFLYSGPVGDGPVLARFSDGPRHAFELTQPSQLHTGDGCLTRGDAYDSFERFYAPHSRLAKVGIVQVMHHGSRGSWHDGVAAKLAPVRSVFSSDPHGSYKHPHAEVLRDFWPFGPVQVDGNDRFWLRGLLAL